ncbi:hypothetical protein [Mucilaginibacter glaciei]|uniref:Uncharacterized protein n=1 Tax=Mucilaginibacter glaciei TaxID=2772109 RepID=A0A926NP09_9SPHI|nr:hypothetical protein [Mucilaginibacter glaciei]MBD1392417.1 hypothetical protein [Mucilaginibacter glaciei]
MTTENIFPGRAFKIDEVSNGVFNFVMTDSDGRKAETTGLFDESFEKVKNFAFDIEKQISKNWNLFLFDLCMLEVNNGEAFETDYNNQAFGSWYIRLENRMLVYNGKDSCLISRRQLLGNWNDVEELPKSELSYLNSIELLNKTFKK